MISERERQGALLLAAAMRRAGKPDREIAGAVLRAREFGVLSAMVDTVADEAPAQSVTELHRDYVYRDECRTDPQEAERQREILDREWGYSADARELRKRGYLAWKSGPPALPVVPEPPVPDQPESPDPGKRCTGCGYLFIADGHKVTCGG